MGAKVKQLGSARVIFDYGMVLTGPTRPKAHAELMRITGLPADQLDPLYWADRHAFDEGKLTGEAYWAHILHKARLTLPPPPSKSSSIGMGACG